MSTMPKTLMMCLVMLSLGMMVIAYPIKAAPAPESFAPLVKKLLPSVVNIRSEVEKKQASQNKNSNREGAPQLPNGLEEFFRQFNLPLPEGFNRNYGQRPNNLPSTALGSGFIIDAAGLVVTNNHVIENSDTIYVTLQDGTDYVAELVGTDPKTDLALLKIDPANKNLVAVEFGDSDQSEVGDWVLAIGNPLGRLGGSVTAGIISARGRNINVGPYDDFIQTDAAINRGNSGGPLFNVNGEVIGINTIIFSPTGGSIGIGFSVPSNLAKNVINQLVEFGSTRRGWLGVLIQDISPEMAESLGDKDLKGALVSQVTKDGPAEAAGFEVGDLITTFDGKPVENSQKLPKLVAETPVGKEVEVIVLRGGENLKIGVTLGQLEKAERVQLATQPNTSKPAEPTKPEITSIGGIELAELSAEIIQKYQLEEPLEASMVVISVAPNSRAAELGIRVGDVVSKLNQIPVTTRAEVEEVVAEARDKNRENLLLLIRSGGGSRFIALPLS